MGLIFYTPRMDQHTELADTNSQENEDFPYLKSILINYYYPNTTKYIGQNSIPRIIDMRSSGITSKMKKELRTEYPAIKLNLLEKSRDFFKNKFKFVTSLIRYETSCKNGQIMEQNENGNQKKCEILPEVSSGSVGDFELVELMDNIVDITLENKGKKPKKNKAYIAYEDLVYQFMFPESNQNEVIKTIFKHSPGKIILVEDQALELIKKPNVFLFLRVVSDNTHNLKKYIYEDVFFRTALFYDYLEICAIEWLKTHKSMELRIYQQHDILVVVYSGTTVRMNGEPKRHFSGVDLFKNSAVIFNRDGPTFIEVAGGANETLQSIAALDLDEGDYAITGANIYKVGDTGKGFKWEDINYFDLVN